MEHEERAIYILKKSEYRLLCPGEYELNDMNLVITDLGNIYVSKVDSLREDFLSDFRIFARLDMIDASLEQRGVSVVCEDIELEIYDNGSVANEVGTLVMVLGFEELMTINQRLKRNVFRFKDDEKLAIINDSMMAVVGTRFTSSHSYIDVKRFLVPNRPPFFELKISDKDIEIIRYESDRLSYRGYMHSESGFSDIIRKIDIVGEVGFEKFSYDGKKSTVDSNKKIGILPREDQVVYSKISGFYRVSYYEDTPVLVIRHENLICVYGYESKEEIFTIGMDEISVIRVGKYVSQNTGINSRQSIESSIILGDGINMILEMVDYDASKIGLSEVKRCDNSSVAITKGNRAVYLSVDDDRLFIRNVEGEGNEIYTVDLRDISEILILDEDDVDGIDMVSTEIRFGNKKVILKMTREFFNMLDDVVYDGYVSVIMEKSDIDELYENWEKSVSDMVVFNLCGYVYHMSKKYDIRPGKDVDVYLWVDFVNSIYRDILSMQLEIDKVAVYMSDILVSNEIDYFSTLDRKIPTMGFDSLERVFFEVRNNLKADLYEVIRILEAIRFCISDPNARKSTTTFMRDNEKYQIELFASQAYDRFWHIIYTMLPHYVVRLSNSIFEAYDLLKDEYLKVGRDELVDELLNRIRDTRVFKNYAVEDGSNLLRRDVVDDLYNMAKFARMRIDSEYYYTGRYR